MSYCGFGNHFGNSGGGNTYPGNCMPGANFPMMGMGFDGWRHRFHEMREAMGGFGSGFNNNQQNPLCNAGGFGFNNNFSQFNPMSLFSAMGNGNNMSFLPGQTGGFNTGSPLNPGFGNNMNTGGVNPSQSGLINLMVNIFGSNAASMFGGGGVNT